MCDPLADFYTTFEGSLPPDFQRYFQVLHLVKNLTKTQEIIQKQTLIYLKHACLKSQDVFLTASEKVQKDSKILTFEALSNNKESLLRPPSEEQHFCHAQAQIASLIFRLQQQPAFESNKGFPSANESAQKIENFDTITNRSDGSILAVLEEEITRFLKKNQQLVENFNELFARLQKRETELDFLKETIEVCTKSLQAEKERRRWIQQELSLLRGCIRVHCRIRKVLSIDFPEKTEVVSKVDEETVEVYNQRGEIYKKNYEFDKVYSASDSQEVIHADIAPYVTNAISGYNVCILAYGQTGSGKTYTMMGVPPKLNGIIPFVSSELFDIIDTKKYCNTTLHCSVLEIYCEELHDLLKDKSANEPRLEIREDSSGAIHIPTLTHKKVCSHVELLALISSAAQKRIKYKTNVHADSSRSHFIVTLNICTVYDTGIEVTSKLQLVDLAGSECVALSKVQGKNLEEAKFINKSLSSLLDVLQTLRKKEKHVPYRNSKLTRYLSDSLGGNSKFILIVCVSPTIKYITETKQSLKFGEDARAVERGKITSNKMNTKT